MKTTKIIALIGTLLLSVQNSRCAERKTEWQDEGQIKNFSAHVIHMYKIAYALSQSTKNQANDIKNRNVLSIDKRRYLSRCMYFLYNAAPRELDRKAQSLLRELAACTLSIVDVPPTVQELENMMTFSYDSLGEVYMLIQKQLAQFQEADKSAMPEEQSLAQRIAAGQKHPRQNADAIRAKGEDTRSEAKPHGSGRRKGR